MNHTYEMGLKLPQPTDELSPEEFNENFRKVENAISFLLACCGYKKDIEYKMRYAFLDLGSINIVAGQNYFTMNDTEYECKVTAGDALIYDIDSTQVKDMIVYPFGKDGAWESNKTGIEICVFVEYLINSYSIANCNRIIAYGMDSGVGEKETLWDLEPVLEDEGTILFPLGQFSIDTGAGTSISKVYPARAYRDDDLKPITMTIGGI